MRSPASIKAQDLRVLKTGVVATVVLLVLATAAGGAAVGGSGALGGALGVLLVAVFFSVSMLAVTAAGRVSPQAMYQAAVTTYIVKILALLGLLAGLRHVSALHPKVFAWSVIGATVVWLVTDVRLVVTTRQLYVTPEESAP